MTRVLVVEDSAVVRDFLTYVLDSDPDIHVAGTACNGEEALRVVDTIEPDVITMDINMPRMDGFEATRRIMETRPTPIVIVSGSWDVREVATTFRAVEAGALAVVARPMGLGHPSHEATASELVQTVKLMSEVKVVRRWARSRLGEPLIPEPPKVELKPALMDIKIVAMGASTGGPIVLQTILSGLPRDFAVPVLIVQHIASGFVQGFVEWLTQSSGFPVRVAIHGEQLLPGRAYVGPDGLHTGVGTGGRIALSTDHPENGLRPSVSYLFRSVTRLYGGQAVGVLLTGMGKDGAQELKSMREQGAVTLAQDEETSVVHGMPGEAVRLDAATYVLSPKTIASTLASLVNRRGADS